MALGTMLERRPPPAITRNDFVISAISLGLRRIFRQTMDAKLAGAAPKVILKMRSPRDDAFDGDPGPSGTSYVRLRIRVLAIFECFFCREGDIRR